MPITIRSISDRDIEELVDSYKSQNSRNFNLLLHDQAYSKIKEVIFNRINDFTSDKFKRYFIYLSYSGDISKIKIDNEIKKTESLTIENLKLAIENNNLELEGNYSWSRLYRKTKNSLQDVVTIRNLLGFILNDEIDIVERINKSVLPETPYHIDGFGMGVISAILHIKDNNNYSVWNNTTEKALRHLGIFPRFNRGSSIGEKYRAIDALQKEIRDKYGFSNLSDVDMFWWVILNDIDYTNHLLNYEKELFEDEDIKEQEELLPLIKSTQSRQDIIKGLKALTPQSPELVEFRGKQYKRDNKTIAQLKILRDFKCQMCSTKILKKDNGFYIEAAHISEKHHGGPETPENILILCPNHHKEFDLGNRKILEKTKEKIVFELNGKKYDIGLKLE